jgi:hypothetical protein
MQLRGDVVTEAKAQPSGQGDPRLLSLQVEAMLVLGNASGAQPLIGQLWNGGYRDAGLLALLQHERIDYPVNAALQSRLLAASGERDR